MSSGSLYQQMFQEKSIIRKGLTFSQVIQIFIFPFILPSNNFQKTAHLPIFCCTNVNLAWCTSSECTILLLNEQRYRLQLQYQLTIKIVCTQKKAWSKPGKPPQWAWAVRWKAFLAQHPCSVFVPFHHHLRDPLPPLYMCPKLPSLNLSTPWSIQRSNITKRDPTNLLWNLGTRIWEEIENQKFQVMAEMNTMF